MSKQNSDGGKQSTKVEQHQSVVKGSQIPKSKNPPPPKGK